MQSSTMAKGMEGRRGVSDLVAGKVAPGPLFFCEDIELIRILILGSSQIRVGSRPILGYGVYPPHPVRRPAAPNHSFVTKRVRAPSVRQSPAQVPRGLVAHAGSTIQLDDGRDDATEFGCGTAAVLAAASTWCKAPGCLDTLVSVFRRPFGWPLSDCL